MDHLFYLQTSQNRLYIWPERPPEGNHHPVALRSEALFKKAQVWNPETARPHPPRDIFLMESMRLPPEKRMQLLKTIRTAFADKLIRVQWPADQSVKMIASSEVLQWRDYMPLTVHFTCAFPITPVFSGPPKLTDFPSAKIFRMAGLPLLADIVLGNLGKEDPQANTETVRETEKKGTHTTEALKKLLIFLVSQGVKPWVLVGGTGQEPPRNTRGEKKGLAAEQVPEQVEKQMALSLVRELRGWVTGLAVPSLVWEEPSGERLELVPGFVKTLSDEGAEVEGFQGGLHNYPFQVRNLEKT